MTVPAMMVDASTTPITTDDSSRQLARLRLATIGHADRILARLARISGPSGRLGLASVQFDYGSRRWGWVGAGRQRCW